jgi:predicted ATP-grasp superfamily ATP-dependent carboligase
MTTEQVLQSSTVEGNIIFLPKVQLERKVYQEVAKKLELIGGRWKGGKVAGFVFNEDPTDMLDQIANGEKRNLKKEFQFFPTPDAIADKLVDLADISESHTILEPSAGQGAIIKAINRVLPGKLIDCVELMPLNQSFLNKIDSAILIGSDLLELNPQKNCYDRIIANPPFTKNQDIDHIYHMYNMLDYKGRIVSIASTHWQFASGKKEQGFKQWLDDNDATIIDLEKGEFKASGTLVSSCIVIIDK